MLQALRDNMKGTMAMVIIGIMVVPFAFFGVDSLFMGGNTQGEAAEVNGEVISEQDLVRSVRLQKQQLLDRFGEQVPADMISEEQLRGPVLTRMINRELLRQAAVEGGMTISDVTVDQMIVSTPQFQQDGRFSAELYTQLLRSMGYTPVGYKRLLIEDLLVNQHAMGLAGSAFATRTDIEQLTALTQQTRSFYSLHLPFDQAAEQVSVTEDEIEAYYQQHQATFMRPEQVAVEYIELNLDDLADAIEVDEASIVAQYEQDVKNFHSSVTRQVAHILIEPGDNAEQKIAEAEQRLAAGEDFAEVARELSDDIGSSELGGDLGTTDGSTFPVEFEEALAQLSVGEVSEPVETDAGTHFIKLLDIEQPDPPSLDEMRDDIRESLALAEAESYFVEQLEALSDAAYNASSLLDVGQDLGLDAEVSDFFDRRGGDGILSNNQVLAEIFSDEVLEERMASPVIELSPNQVVVVKLHERRPAAVEPLEDVRDEVRADITANKVAVLQDKQAEVLLAELEAGQSVEAVAESHELEWQANTEVRRNEETIDPVLLEHIFQLPKPDSSGPVNTDIRLDNGDLVVAQLTVVKAGQLPPMDERQQALLQQRLAEELGGAELALYQSALAERADIDIRN